MKGMEDTLERFRVGTIKTAYYIPEYLTKEEEQNLLRKAPYFAQ
jgi:hypothetical protein